MDYQSLGQITGKQILGAASSDFFLVNGTDQLIVVERFLTIDVTMSPFVPVALLTCKAVSRYSNVKIS